jgi:tetratricopeptide (TPR) repeat protein
MGIICLIRHDLEGAESNFRKASELSPEYPKPLLHLGLLAMDRNQPDAALKFIEKARAVEDLGQDEDARIVASIVNIYLREQKFTEAQEILNKAIPRFPQDSHLFFLQGVLYERENKINDAEDALQRALMVNQSK